MNFECCGERESWRLPIHLRGVEHPFTRREKRRLRRSGEREAECAGQGTFSGNPHFDHYTDMTYVGRGKWSVEEATNWSFQALLVCLLTCIRLPCHTTNGAMYTETAATAARTRSRVKRQNVKLAFEDPTSNDRARISK